MSTSEVVATFKSAEDSMGVITPDALRHQLSNLTVKDWQDASKVFSKHSASDIGFYIENNQGIFTVHNDMRTAQNRANTSPLQAVWQDFKSDGLVFGLSDVGASVMSASVLAMAGLPAEVALGIAGSAAVGVGLLFAGVDYYQNKALQKQAQIDLHTSRTLKFDAHRSFVVNVK